jgi:SAM-dependent methyltransferase
MIEHEDIVICPACGGRLKTTADGIECEGCQNRYGLEEGIPLLFLPNEWDNSKQDVTDVVKAFYEQVPFPNYEKLENVADLVQKARKGVFARLLHEQIPFEVRVLEVGCGTGQLTNFLSVAQRTVVGTDICLNSLKLAHDFKKRNRLKNAAFYQMNLFRPIFREESFAVVICNGVLHHTSDPFGGFQSVSRLVRKGGHVVIGLYDRYGRIMTDLRRIAFRLTGDRLLSLDPRLRVEGMGEARRSAWFMDQYKNPHESKHTLKEVQGWFEQCDFTFVNSVPKLKAVQSFSENEPLFRDSPRGNWLDHLLFETKLSVTGSREGGFFVAIGRRNP